MIYGEPNLRDGLRPTQAPAHRLTVWGVISLVVVGSAESLCFSTAQIEVPHSVRREPGGLGMKRKSLLEGPGHIAPL